MNHWQTLQQNYRTCYKQIRWTHTSNIFHVTFHWISAAYFWLQIFNKKLIKEINVLGIFVKEQCFEKKCFDNKWKEFSSVMDRPMFWNMSKTFCNLETRNMEINAIAVHSCISALTVLPFLSEWLFLKVDLVDATQLFLVYIVSCAWVKYSDVLGS